MVKGQTATTLISMKIGRKKLTTQFQSTHRFMVGVKHRTCQSAPLDQGEAYAESSMLPSGKQCSLLCDAGLGAQVPDVRVTSYFRDLCHVRISQNQGLHPKNN